MNSGFPDVNAILAVWWSSDNLCRRAAAGTVLPQGVSQLSTAILTGPPPPGSPLERDLRELGFSVRVADGTAGLTQALDAVPAAERVAVVDPRFVGHRHSLRLGLTDPRFDAAAVPGAVTVLPRERGTLTGALAAVAASRAAYIGGFSSTSDLAAGFRYGIPTTGTSAHAFTLLHDSEREAFAAQVDSLGAGTTLLVDTYDVPEAVRTAVEVAGPKLGAVRIDSGDLLVAAHRVRQQLDELGAHDARIVVTSDLDEYAIASLAAAPVDAYGVGTQLVTGSGHPTASMVYKLVARASANGPDAPLVPVAKKSLGGKLSVGGRKWAARPTDAHGIAEAEVVGTGPVPEELAGRQVAVELMRDGRAVARETLDAARDRHAQARDRLPLSATQLSRGEPVLPTRYVGTTP